MPDITFADLEKDPFQRGIIEILQQYYGTPLADDLKNLLVDYAGNAQLRVNQKVAWIQSAALMTRRIVEDTAHEAEYPLFWVRLYSIVREYYPKVRQRQELYHVLDFLRPELQALEDLVSRLSDDDLCFIEFMRHNHVHMHVDYVRYQAVRKKDDSLRIAPPKNPDAVGLARRILDANDWNQQKTACDFAKRIVNDINRLAEVVTAAAESED